MSVVDTGQLARLEEKWRALDKARRAFLAECSLVVSVPIAFWLEGSPYSNTAVPLPLHYDLQLGIITSGRSSDSLIERFPHLIARCPHLRTDWDGFATHVVRRSAGVDRWEARPYVNPDSWAKHVQVRNDVIELLDRAEMRVWSWLPAEWVKPWDLRTAFGLLVYCLENNLSADDALQERRRELTALFGDLDDETLATTVGLNSGLDLDLSSKTLHSITEAWRLCWTLQPYTNGASSLAQLVCHSGSSWRYDIALRRTEEVVDETLADLSPLPEWAFDVVNAGLQSFQIRPCLDWIGCDLILGYLEEGFSLPRHIAQRLFGPILMPLVERRFETAELVIKLTPEWNARLLCKPLPKSNGALIAVCGPRETIDRVRTELGLIQDFWLHGREPISQVRFTGARILDPSEYQVESVAAPSQAAVASRETGPYALMWTNDPDFLTKHQQSPREPGALAVDNADFNDLYKDKERFQVFIVDRGEYDNRSVGEVYIGGKPASRATQGDASVIRELSDLEYRLFDYLLRNHDHENNRYIFDLVRHCWLRSKEEIDTLRELYKNSKSDFSDDTATFRNKFYELDDILAEYKVSSVKCGVKNRKHGLNPWPTFCVVHVLHRG